MGTYGAYVWSAYGLAVIVLAMNLILPLRRRRVVRRQLENYYRIKEDE